MEKRKKSKTIPALVLVLASLLVLHQASKRETKEVTESKGVDIQVKKTPEDPNTIGGITYVVPKGYMIDPNHRGEGSIQVIRIPATAVIEGGITRYYVPAGYTLEGNIGTKRIVTYDAPIETPKTLKKDNNLVK